MTVDTTTLIELYSEAYANHYSAHSQFSHRKRKSAASAHARSLLPEADKALKHQLYRMKRKPHDTAWADIGLALAQAAAQVVGYQKEKRENGHGSPSSLFADQDEPPVSASESGSGKKTGAKALYADLAKNGYIPQDSYIGKALGFGGSTMCDARRLLRAEGWKFEKHSLGPYLYVWIVTPPPEPEPEPEPTFQFTQSQLEELVRRVRAM